MGSNLRELPSSDDQCFWNSDKSNSSKLFKIDKKKLRWRKVNKCSHHFVLEDKGKRTVACKYCNFGARIVLGENTLRDGHIYDKENNLVI